MARRWSAMMVDSVISSSSDPGGSLQLVTRRARSFGSRRSIRFCIDRFTATLTSIPRERHALHCRRAESSR